MGLYEDILGELQKKKTQRTKAVYEYLVNGTPKAFAKIVPRREGEYEPYTERLSECLNRSDALDLKDRRIIHILFKVVGGYQRSEDRYLGRWLDMIAGTENPGEDLFAPVRSTLLEAGFTEDEILKYVILHTNKHETREYLNSLGRYLLALDETTLRQASVLALCGGWIAIHFTDFFIKYDAERINRVIHEEWMKENRLVSCGNIIEHICSRLLRHAPDQYLGFVDFAFRAVPQVDCRYELGRLLCRHDPEKNRREVIELGIQVIRTEQYYKQRRFDVAVNALSDLGRCAWPMMKECLRDGWAVMDRYDASKDKKALAECVEKLESQDALEVLKVALKAESPLIQVMALEHIVKLNPGGEDALIEAAIKELIKSKSLPEIARTVRLAGNWNVARMAETIWSVMDSKSNPVRLAAARALAGLGEAALERAAKLLEAKKSEARLAATALLERIGTPRAMEILEARLDAEQGEAVRDAIFRALDRFWTAQGREVPFEEIQRRMERTKKLLGTPPAKWADAALLPPVYLKDGRALEREMVQYLIYRQSRCKEITPDVEAKALYRQIDRTRSHDFAQAVLQAFLAYTPITMKEIKAANIYLRSLIHDKAGNYFLPNAPAEERWALALAALTGDDRLVKPLVAQVIEWTAPTDGAPARGPMAVYGVQALKLLGSDATLMAVDSLAFRFRAKWKNVGAAATAALAQEAEERGITLDELGDRTVPWLGFEPGRPRLIEHDGKRIEATVGSDLKFQFRDLATRKAVKAIPKSLPEEVLLDFKTQGEVLKEAVKAQTPRLENLMVRQQRWPLDRWRELFLGHPILRPYGVRLVWGAYDAEGALLKTFRPLEDGSLTDEEDEAVALEAGGAARTVGILHPMELEDEDRKRWRAHLADYEVKPPFPQLERPVVLVTPEQAGERACRVVAEATLAGGTFGGRAGRLGWGRSLDDDRGIPFFYKSFPLAGIDFLLFVDGYYLGMDPSEDVTLRHGFFVPAGSVDFREYLEFPEDEKDEGVLALDAVPPIVYSEVMGDLEKIAAGKKDAEA